ncbi:hypothetical protein [Phycisphaera mikurensis]|uniref:Lipoprotein n=1 Tax=Phycisphaera mikurensis (strain NBRC 102666 / KCTC 22515 / FYK2301M01) TaxID=1142394 RepID=I0IJ18_PHYMF|nr:hypothetical protein [Phycisphaera mikurensis]MBB6443103.1 hypothetical protein [Phycisphaera mikurensis]BAM05256.1 hypothetical protein PSMK_30970 [Phycisphaera mikurensis NBRC 102666]
MWNLLPMLLLAAALAGCAAPPPPQADIDAADFGDPPITFRSQIREALGQTLYDPPTAQLRYEPPFRAVVRSGGGWTAGWVVPVAVKARGPRGAYSTFLPRRFFFPSGGGCFELHGGQQAVPASD